MIAQMLNYFNTLSLLLYISRSAFHISLCFRHHCVFLTESLSLSLSHSLSPLLSRVFLMDVFVLVFIKFSTIECKKSKFAREIVKNRAGPKQVTFIKKNSSNFSTFSNNFHLFCQPSSKLKLMKNIFFISPSCFKINFWSTFDFFK